MNAKDRAAEVAALPHVKAWVKRFEKLAKDMPPEVWIYVASGVPHVMAHSPEGSRYEKSHGGSDVASLVASMPRGKAQWDGGDW